MADQSKRGPKPDCLKIEGEDWEAAVRKAVQKQRPPDGWPKPDKPVKPKLKKKPESSRPTK